jgi:hypothetical protein
LRIHNLRIQKKLVSETGLHKTIYQGGRRALSVARGNREENLYKLYKSGKISLSRYDKLMKGLIKDIEKR